jgi:putative membrane protein
MLDRRTYLAALCVAFAVAWALLAINPHDRSDWLLENVLLVAFAAALLASHRALPLSRISYTTIFAFALLHTIGAHYTYSLVPWQDWLHGLSGGAVAAPAAERNHFDRLVHFFYGLLLAYPVREVFLRVAELRGFWGYFFPLNVTLSTSVLYELAEWAAAEVFGGDLGVAFLGTQGDVWDAQKDMALAGAGAVIAMAITAALNYALERDFAMEWVESLRVKHPAPLGEDEIRRLWLARKRSHAPGGTGDDSASTNRPAASGGAAGTPPGEGGPGRDG